ncbi:hypothetical protein [Methylobacterium nodulans]|uniref:Uncharacterized protein n=1 Tax=Methylobacterium nodulans (strain LMG 21967 / CNCM I-2342 / ORS 2060) TaxID=460265 RepID=B8IW44_METNO|nr:hypothetical protein [Methylobacterium nodulans]ACL62634.1 hypothetical protein Mnod_8540 [Methylobacterium nodulans ORS 2060]
MTEQPRLPLMSLPLGSRTCERIASKARSVEQAMRERFAAQWSAAQIDLLYLHYLYGVVMTALPDAEPRVQIGFLRHLAGRSLTTDAVTTALHACPASGDPSSLARSQPPKPSDSATRRPFATTPTQGRSNSSNPTSIQFGAPHEHVHSTREGKPNEQGGI